MKAISAHVPGYIDWALNFSKKERSDNHKSFPLTVPKDNMEDELLNTATKWWNDKGIFKNDSFKLIFNEFKSQEHLNLTKSLMHQRGYQI